jgi:hypothetical protein
LVVDRAGQKDIADDGNGTPQIGTRTSVTGDIDDVSMCLNPSVDLFTRWYASVTSGGKILRTQIEIPNEYLKDPRGYRAFIVDYDSSNDAFRRPKAIASLSKSVDGTPKSLWALFKKKGKAQTAGRLETLCSTKAGKHGSVTSGTEVPQHLLVDELKKDSAFTSTEETQDAFCHKTELVF